MSCSHCKGSITPVVIDESLSKMITMQAKYIHQLEASDEVLHAIKRLLEKNYMVSAMDMIDSHFKNQGFKG